MRQSSERVEFKMATGCNLLSSSASESADDGEPSSKDLKLVDLNEFSNIFSSEFNKSDIHDRVLCFQIIEDDELDKIIDHNDTCESERATESNSWIGWVVTSRSENKSDEKGGLKDGMLVNYNLSSVCMYVCIP